jgi:hypothetical protein
MRTIPRIVAHLELDGAGIATQPAFGEHEERGLVEQCLEAAGERAGGGIPRGMLRSSAPSAKMASPTPIVPTSAGKTRYDLWIPCG